MHSSGFFRIKLIARLILKREISGSHTISDQSLLLSTIVLNDNRAGTVFGNGYMGHIYHYRKHSSLGNAYHCKTSMHGRNSAQAGFATVRKARVSAQTSKLGSTAVRVGFKYQIIF